MARLVSDDVWAILTIYGEARGELFDGKVAVGEVIRARARRKFSSDGTVPGTVLRSFQFSCFNTGDPNRILAAKLEDDNPLVVECADAWAKSATSRLTGGAVYYFNPKGVVTMPAWAKPELLGAIIGAHHFYRDR